MGFKKGIADSQKWVLIEVLQIAKSGSSNRRIPECVLREGLLIVNKCCKITGDPVEELLMVVLVSACQGMLYMLSLTLCSMIILLPYSLLRCLNECLC